jgi:hypothetical protein
MAASFSLSMREAGKRSGSEAGFEEQDHYSVKRHIFNGIDGP